MVTKLWTKFFAYFCVIATSISLSSEEEGLPLYYWRTPTITNFGDYLSVKLVERIINGPVTIFKKQSGVFQRKLLAVGSILSVASDYDVIWGCGVNGKTLMPSSFHFSYVDIRAVRGPLTRQFILDNFGLSCPEVYGDPVLLFPYFFPEFQRKENPSYEYIIIPHYTEKHLFPKEVYSNVVYPTDPWDEVVNKILSSKFVISSSLHGIVVAEAYGIPARLLKITYNEPLFKYQDYYWGTGRPYFTCASSVEEALTMGGEPPFVCDLAQLLAAFPFEFWPNAHPFNLTSDK